MQSMAYTAYESMTAGSGFTVTGDLEWRQRALLPQGGPDYRTSVRTHI